jgi:replicative DNA helicase
VGLPALPDRLPPQSIDAEQAALGAALISRTATDAVVELLEREDFYLDAHRKLHEVITYLADRDQPVDTLSVSEELAKREQLEGAGGLAYLLTLTDSVPTAAHVEHYARIVKRKSISRKLITAGQTIDELARNEELEADDLLNCAEEVVLAIGTQRQAVPVYNARNLMLATLETYGATALAPERAVSTGFPGVDRRMQGGFLPGKVYLVAGRPSMGKSALAVELLLTAGRTKKPAALLSLEMPRADVGVRMQCADTALHDVRYGVPLTTVLNHANPELPDQLTETQQSLLAQAVERVVGYPLHIVDESDVTAGQIRALARRLVREQRIEMLVIDYLQIISWDPKAENENAALTLIMKSLQATARKLGIALVVLSQLTRSNERRGGADLRPMLSDLRGSGMIEQVADAVMFIHRPQYYARQKAGQRDDGEGLVELIIAKNRQGAVGMVKLHGSLGRCRIYQPAAGHFEGHAPEPEQPQMELPDEDADWTDR